MLADLWRYLVIYKFGGFYIDLDTAPFFPIESLDEYPFGNTGMIIALENEVHFC